MGTPRTLRSWITIDERNDDTQEAAPDSPWRDLARGVPEASRALAVSCRTGPERPSSQDQRDRARTPGCHGRYGSPARALLRHVGPVLAESSGPVRPGSRE